jgi:hypothetical protein
VVTRRKLTLDAARTMDFDDLVSAAHAMIEPYEVDGEAETPEELDKRIDRTFDELPDVYGWLLQLESFFDHWTDFFANQYGLKSLEYKAMRQKRDAMERAAKAAKLRYDATSRRLTKMQSHERESQLPRSRG